MPQRAVRGATTVLNDIPSEIETATVEMLEKIIKDNDINVNDIVSAIFSVTNDIKSATPAKFARTNLGWHYVPLMCVREFEFDNSLTKCIRVLIAFNSNKNQKEIKHVYLKNAAKLRPDLNN